MHAHTEEFNVDIAGALMITGVLSLSALLGKKKIKPYLCK